jgi:hypothetical protein
MVAGCALAPMRSMLEPLGELDATTSKFAMPVKYSPPYQLLVGVPKPERPESQAPAVRFEGSISIRGSDGTAAVVPISAATASKSTWLDEYPDERLTAYIVTWEAEIDGQQFSKWLRRGQDYAVEVTFTTPPPAGSSLWLASLTR